VFYKIYFINLISEKNFKKDNQEVTSNKGKIIIWKKCGGAGSNCL